MKSLVPLAAGLWSALALVARAAEAPASPADSAGPDTEARTEHGAPAAAPSPGLKPGPMMSLDAAFIEVRAAYEQIGLRLTEKERELRKAVAAQQAARLRAEQLETQLADAQTDRLKLKQDVDRLRKQVDDAQEAIAGLLNTLTSLEEQLAQTQSDNRRLTQERAMLEATAKGATERMKVLEEERDRARRLLAEVQDKLRGLLGDTEPVRVGRTPETDSSRIPPASLPGESAPRTTGVSDDRAAPREIALEPVAAKPPVTRDSGTAAAEAPVDPSTWTIPTPVLDGQPPAATAIVYRAQFKPPAGELEVAALKPMPVEAPKPAVLPPAPELPAAPTNEPPAVATAPTGAPPAVARAPAVAPPVADAPVIPPPTVAEMPVSPLPAAAGTTSAPPAVAAAPTAAPPAAPESTSRTGLLERASAALESGRFKEARMYYEEASRMDPGDRLATLGLAESMLATGDTAAAEKLAIQLLSSDRKNAGYLFLAGRIASATGRYQEATVHLENAMHEAPEDPAIRRELASVYYGLNRLGDAADMFRSVLDFDPNDGETHFNLAAVLLMNDPPWPAEAARHYQEALRLGEPRDENIEKLLPH